MEPRKIPKLVKYKQWDCAITISYYGTNGRIAIVANDFYDGGPVAVLSKNLVDYPIGKDEVAIDTNNCGQEAVDALMEAEIIGPELRTADSGFCTYPIHKLLV